VTERAGADPSESLGSVASELRAAIWRFWRRTRRDLGARQPEITPVRLEVLSLLERFGTMPIGDVAARAQMHPSTMTRVVDALEQRELVVRAVDARDRRAVMVQISEGGRRELGRARASQDRLLTQALERLTAEDRDHLIEAIPLLVRVTEAMDDGDGGGAGEGSATIAREGGG
jgi:DNA-binding MarR family transcriptional regulator